MARELSLRTSLEVVVLERGQARKTSDYAANMDEVDYSIRLRMMQNVAEETMTHRWTVRDQSGCPRSQEPLRTCAPIASPGHEP